MEKLNKCNFSIRYNPSRSVYEDAWSVDVDDGDDCGTYFTAKTYRAAKEWADFNSNIIPVKYSKEQEEVAKMLKGIEESIFHFFVDMKWRLHDSLFAVSCETIREFTCIKDKGKLFYLAIKNLCRYDILEIKEKGVGNIPNVYLFKL